MYTLWIYPDDGVRSFYTKSFPSCDDAMRAASAIIARGAATKINVVHSASGSALHTWERGSWRIGA